MTARRHTRFSPLVLVMGAVIALAAGCGSSSADLARAATAGASAQAVQQQKADQAKAERAAADKAIADKAAADQAAADKAAADKAAADAKAVADKAAADARPATTSCGGTVSAGGTTSCSFANNVAYAYLNYGNGTTNVSAYSPVTQEFITMHCVAGVPVVCRGGRAAVVYIR